MTTGPERNPAADELRLTERSSGFARRGQVWFYGDDV